MAEDKWLRAFGARFSDGDKTDQIPRILEIPTPRFRAFLETVVKQINDAFECVFPGWEDFRWGVLRAEACWGEKVFRWPDSGRQTSGAVDVDWERLADDPRRYFLAYMALRGAWWLSKELPDVWRFVNEAAEEKGVA